MIFNKGRACKIPSMYLAMRPMSYFTSSVAQVSSVARSQNKAASTASSMNVMKFMNLQQTSSLIHVPLRSFARKSTKQLKKEEEEQEKEEKRQKFQDVDLDDLYKGWRENFEECVDDLQEALKELKKYRASPNMFDDVQVQAYGGKHDLSELGQTIVRGENNLLVSVYDDTVKEAVMKAIMIYDPELECSVEGKYISVKMAKTRAENREKIVEEAKSKHTDYKSELGKERTKGLETLKELEKILPMEDIDIFREKLEDSFKEYQKKGQEVIDKKIEDIRRK